MTTASRAGMTTNISSTSGSQRISTIWAIWYMAYFLLGPDRQAVAAGSASGGAVPPRWAVR